MQHRGHESGPRRWGRAQNPANADPYRTHGKEHGPAACPQCGAVLERGSWRWGAAPDGAAALACPACRRIADRQPAGVLHLSGSWIPAHRAELEAAARNQEAAERREHPLNRIMWIEERDGAVEIATTDLHLPHRIGNALRHAYRGTLEQRFDEDGWFAEARWSRDD